MNKALMLSAAAVLAGTGAASAGTYSFQFGSSYCDGGTVYTGYGAGNLEVWTHTNSNCNGGTSMGGGALARSAAWTGKQYNDSDNNLAKNYGTYEYSFSYVLPKKIGSAKPWALFCYYDFATFHSAFECNSGILINVARGVRKPVGHSHISTVSKVLAALRNRG